MFSIQPTKRYSCVVHAKEAFETNGYFVHRKFLSSQEVASLLEEIETSKLDCIKKKRIHPAPFQALFSAQALESLRHSCQGAELFGNHDTLGHGLHLVLPRCQSLAESPQLNTSVFTLTSIQRARIVQTKVILKPAKSGAKVPTHTDEQYIFTNPISGLALWIALDEASQENGCVQVVPRSHVEFEPGQRFTVDPVLEPRIARWVEQPPSGENKRAFPYTKKESDALPWQPVECQPGDCLFMDVRLLHASSSNSSSRQRRAITLHLVDGECHWDEKNWLVPVTV